MKYLTNIIKFVFLVVSICIFGNTVLGSNTENNWPLYNLSENKALRSTELDAKTVDNVVNAFLEQNPSYQKIEKPVFTLLAKAGSAIHLDNLNKTKLYLDDAKALCPSGCMDELSYEIGMIEAILMLRTENLKEADDLLKILEKAEFSKIPINKIRLDIAYGWRGLFAHQYASAMDKAVQAYELSHKIGDSTYMARSSELLSQVYGSDSNMDKYKAYLNLSIDLFEKMKDVQGIIGAKVLMAMYYDKNNEYLECISFIEDMLQEYKGLISNSRLGKLYFVAGKSLARIGQLPKATEYLEKATSKASIDDNTRIEMLSGLLLCSIYFETNDNANFEKHLDLLSSKIGQIDDNYLILHYHEHKANDFKRKGMLDSAIYHMEELFAGELKLIDDVNSTKLESVMGDFEGKIKQQEQKVFELEALNLKRNIVLISALAFLLIALLVLYIQRQSVRNERNKHKAEILQSEALIKEKELENKKQQITDFSMKSIQKRTLLESLLTQIKRARELTDEPLKNRKLLGEIISSLKQDLLAEKEEQEFGEMINQIDESKFQNKLKSINPSLNEKDKKIAIMLRLRMSSKEIASAMNLTTRSVETYRSTLRKKLHLDKQDNLLEFIAEL